MKKVLLITTSIVLSSTAIGGFATSFNSHNPANGFYVSANAGIGGMDTPKLTSAAKSAANHTYEQDIGGFAARVAAGYLWQLTSLEDLHLGAEAGYNYYPVNKYSLGPASYGLQKEKWEYRGFNVDVLGVAQYNILSSGWFVVGKAGGAYTYQKVKQSGLAAGHSKKHKVLPEVAAGIGYDFTQHIGVDLAYSHIFGNRPGKIQFNSTSLHTLNSVASVNMLTLGLVYHF